MDRVKEWNVADGWDGMPRPQKHRWVAGRPCATHFKPQGIPWCELEEVVLTIEEFEAVRLKDAEGLEQEECARQMQISRPTFVRLIQNARKKVALALTQGKGLRIEGGHHKFYGEKGQCRRNGEAWRHQKPEFECQKPAAPSDPDIPERVYGSDSPEKPQMNKNNPSRSD